MSRGIEGEGPCERHSLMHKVLVECSERKGIKPPYENIPHFAPLNLEGCDERMRKRRLIREDVQISLEVVQNVEPDAALCVIDSLASGTCGALLEVSCRTCDGDGSSDK